MNNLELETMSSAKTVDVAPDVEPVIVSPFLKEPAKVFCSSTTLSPASKLKAFVLSNKTKLLVVPSVSKSMWSISVNVCRVISADSKNKKYDVKNSVNLGWFSKTNWGTCCLTRVDIFFLFVFFLSDITYHLITAGSSISCTCLWTTAFYFIYITSERWISCIDW